jgi:hypothetical protein
VLQFRSIVLVLAAALWSGSALAYDCSQETYSRAKTKMELLFGTGVLQNYKGGGGLAVLVSDRYWNAMTFPQKQLFADELVCAVAGVRKGLMKLSFRSLMSGKVLAEWSLGKLEVK